MFALRFSAPRCLAAFAPTTAPAAAAALCAPRRCKSDAAWQTLGMSRDEEAAIPTPEENERLHAMRSERRARKEEMTAAAGVQTRMSDFHVRGSGAAVEADEFAHYYESQ